jgi:hypothetical protein
LTQCSRAADGAQISILNIINADFTGSLATENQIPALKLGAHSGQAAA